jgi:hypothetical protein
MDEICSPLQRKGERNIFCSFYNGCLDHAIRESWPYWDCGDCRHKFDQGARAEIVFFAGNAVENYDLSVKL